MNAAEPEENAALPPNWVFMGSGFACGDPE